MMADCVFCKIVAKQIPATVVHEDEHTLAFMDIGQVNPGHVLVAVKKHAENIFALDDAQAAAVFRAAATVARAIRGAFEPPGLSVYQANGAAAGQTVMHLHIHLVPRHDGDGMALAWPVKNPPRERLTEYADKIRARLG
ncbi:MAG TPA: HIT family protein [Burkholderiales bacterium]|jgi:histidine triad (HIT) family protein|nr:HIT family protein [Burkholderiales bacterium]